MLKKILLAVVVYHSVFVESAELTIRMQLWLMVSVESIEWQDATLLLVVVNAWLLAVIVSLRVYFWLVHTLQIGTNN